MGEMADGSGGETMNVSLRDGIKWFPGLTAGPPRETTAIQYVRGSACVPISQSFTIVYQYL